MKIVVSSQGEGFESPVDPRFGRCQYFAFVDLDTLALEVIGNTNSEQNSGVGIRSAQFVADQGVKAVLTGNVGPKAQQVLSTAGVEIVTGVSGSVREVAEAYKAGRLRAGGVDRENDGGKDVRDWQRTPPTGGPAGGMKRQPGRGMGKCRGTGPGCADTSPAGGGAEAVISGLRAEVDGLREQMRYLQEQISRVQKGRE